MHWSEVTLPALFCSGQNPYSAPTQQVLFPHPHSTSSLLEPEAHAAQSGHQRVPCGKAGGRRGGGWAGLCSWNGPGGRRSKRKGTVWRWPRRHRRPPRCLVGRPRTLAAGRSLPPSSALPAFLYPLPQLPANHPSFLAPELLPLPQTLTPSSMPSLPPYLGNCSW